MGPGFLTQPLDHLILALVAFLILGPKRFPELARSAGHWLREAKTAFSLTVAESDDPTHRVAPAPVNTNPAASALDGGGAAGTGEVEAARSRYRDMDAID